MQVRVKEVAAFVGGSVVDGVATANAAPAHTGDSLLSGIAGLTEAKTGDLSFLANPKYAPHLANAQATAVLVSKSLPNVKPAQIVVGNPDLAFAKLVTAFGPQPSHPPAGIHPTAVIGERVTLGANPRIGAYAVIGDGVVIGDNAVIHPHVVLGTDVTIANDVILYPHVTIRERCRIGNRVILHPGVVIGADGFGYALLDGKHQKIPQIGIVILEDDVEIGANTTIDRARFGKTRIGSGTKIDNLVQIAHNVETGSHCIIVSQVGIAGSTKLGHYVTIGGQAGIVGHITIGDQAAITGQAGITKNVPAKAVLRGSPAQDFKLAQHQEIAVRRLPATQQTVRELLDRVAALEAKIAGKGS